MLVYQTPPLTDDLTIAGPIDVSLNVSTTGTDGDWVVKVIDVYPGANPGRTRTMDGHFQMLLAGDILRAKFRNSMSAPGADGAGSADEADASRLGDKYHTFLKGHRLMVQIQSSWFPMFDRNPQTFVDIYHAKDSRLPEGDAQGLPIGVAAVVRHAASARRAVITNSPIPKFDYQFTNCCLTAVGV